MKKSILVSLLVLAFAGSGSPQACGYIFAKFQIVNASGDVIKGAKIDLLDRDDNESILYKKEELIFSEAEMAFKLHHGMCGSHHGTRLIVSHPDYDTFEKLVDLPLNSSAKEHVFIIKLTGKGMVSVKPSHQSLIEYLYD